MKQLFRRSTPSRQVGLLLANDRIMLAAVGNPPVFATRTINGPQEWAVAMNELFSRHGLAKSTVRVALAASLYQQIQIDKPAVPDAEMAGRSPGPSRIMSANPCCNWRWIMWTCPPRLPVALASM